MLKNFLKISLRSLLRYKGFTAINIFGLALGLACSLVIFLYSSYELGYDSFHPNADNIYRLNYDERPVRGEGGRHLPTSSPPMGPALVADYPEAEAFLRLRFSENDILNYNEKSFFEDDIVYADSSFFNFFDFPLKYGDPQAALFQPNSVVLTAGMAEKYFGDSNPLQETITLNNEVALQVTGVLAELPKNSHLRFDALVSFSTFRVPTGYPVTLESWAWISFHTYLKLSDNTNSEAMQDKLAGFLERHMPERAGRFTLSLQPLQEIYLGEPKNTDVAGANPMLPYSLLVVGIFILLLAAANYINIATALSFSRGKEVGIRKTIGARQNSLLGQFLGESILVAVISYLLAAAFMEQIFSWLNEYFGIALLNSSADYLALYLYGLATAIIVGVIAGSYPALIISRFRPVQVLKGKFQASASGRVVRKALLVFQFCIAIALIASTIIMSQQVDFISQKDLGFNDEQVIALHMQRDGSDVRFSRLQERLLDNPRVIAVSASSGMMDGDNGSQPIFPEGRQEDDEPLVANIYGVGYNFYELLDIEQLQGRTFDEAFATDRTESIVINEKAAQLLGFENPVGKKMRIGRLVDGEIIGVVADFHFASLHSEIQPLAMFMTDLVENVYIKVRAGNVAETLASLERDWQMVASEQPFHFTFLDAHVARMYNAEQNFSLLITIFSVVALVIAGLGLYGLVALIVQQRTKEIGIRKVLGANIAGIVGLLSRDFLLLILVANLVAWPLAYFAMSEWLQNFAYRIDLSVWVFIAAGGITLAIALLTIINQVFRAAIANPVKSLRYE